MFWHTEYEIGIQALDHEHEKLFEHFDSLIERFVREENDEAALEFLGFLDRYIDSHFKNEENLMDRFGFPGARMHKAQHRLFESEFLKLKREFETVGASKVSEVRLVKITTQWWIDHIRQSDKKLGEFLKSAMGHSEPVAAGLNR